MNRRNFILGLGTAATLSGAASVTGAALSNDVSPAANFQVIATDELVVERNENVNLGSNNNYSDTPVSDFEFNDATLSDPGGQTTPNLTVNESTNGDLGIAFATENNASRDFNLNESESSAGSIPYNGTGESGGDGQVGPLQVRNDGGSQKNVGVEYDLGADVGGAFTADDLAQLFTFNIGGTKISPDQGDGVSSGVLTQDSDNNTVQVDAGEIAVVNFVINYSADLEDKLSQVASGSSGFGFDNTGTSTADLLDSVIFGDDS